MPNLLIRDVSGKVIARLKARAAANGRSLQAELKQVVEGAAPDLDRVRRVAARLRKKTSGRKHSDSAILLREDRDR